MVKIVTLAFNRPDFLELQLSSIKKWVPEFEFEVYDNCPDDAIKDECKRLGIACIPIKIFSEDTSWAVGLSLNKMWETLQHEKGKLWYIDSDMFLINELPRMDCDMAFVPQIRGEYTYPWTGLMYFNMDTLPHPKDLRWEVDYRVTGTDVGGLNHFYLKDNDLWIQELEMWTLIDEQTYSFNGVDSTLGNRHREMGVLADTHFMPKPYSFDMFCLKDQPFFIFHYKSASNYPPFYTPEYNRLKTKALKQILW